MHSSRRFFRDEWVSCNSLVHNVAGADPRILEKGGVPNYKLSNVCPLKALNRQNFQIEEGVQRQSHPLDLSVCYTFGYHKQSNDTMCILINSVINPTHEMRTYDAY